MTNTISRRDTLLASSALVATSALGSKLAQAQAAPLADADGKPVMGDNKYVQHFNKDELPPAGAFWSLTMYDAEGFQVDNSINRFAIGDRDALKFAADGSLDLYIQHENPGPEKAANWLPAPKSGPLGLTMRLYAPKPQALDGRWNPPPIRRLCKRRLSLSLTLGRQTLIEAHMRRSVGCRPMFRT